MHIKKLVAAILSTGVFLVLMMLIDKYLGSETYGTENYWQKLLFMGVLMFLFNLLPEHIKNTSWKTLFGNRRSQN